MNVLRLTMIALVVVLLRPVFADEPNGQVWDTYSDTWVATDGLARVLPSSVEVGLPRDDKTVGIFYFLWLGRHGEQGPFDISKILRADPTAIDNPLSPEWGADRRAAPLGRTAVRILCLRRRLRFAQARSDAV